jgi:HAE1 family hydrophobic/amphiphilic exporter-1
MTSFAFILGVLPLVWAEGAAAASRQALGTAVCGGMITSTVLAVFFVPVFYVAVQGFIEYWSGPPAFIPAGSVHVVSHPAQPIVATEPAVPAVVETKPIDVPLPAASPAKPPPAADESNPSP